MVFSSRFAAMSLRRSAPRSITTLRSPSIGLAWHSRTNRSASSFTIWVVDGSISTTSGCSPRRTSSHERSSSPATSVAAKQRAASSTPEPRGPTSEIGVDGSRRRALQERHGLVLTDDPVPSERGHGCSRSRTTCPHRVLHLVDRAAGIDQRHPRLRARSRYASWTASANASSSRSSRSRVGLAVAVMRRRAPRRQRGRARRRGRARAPRSRAR